MYKRKESSDYLWIFPLLAAICASIAILTPTAHFGSGGTTWDWWMWAFTTLGVTGYYPVSLFVFELDFLILSIITTSVMVLNVLNMIFFSVSSKKKKLKTNNFILRAVLSGLVLISIMIYHAFTMASAFYDGLSIEGVPFPPGFHFWFEFRPSFGIILPFISAILLFVGAGMFQRYSKEIVYPVQPKPEYTGGYIQSKSDVATRYIPPEARNFCPECGYKLLRPDTSFCTKCGFKL
ncbi:MAG: zinc-ribbon domain-containing protein [Promethearchaeota archaeon]|jgi:hypothetical protein